MKWKLKDNILLEDEHLIVVNKPAGLLSIPDRQQNKSLKDQLIKEYGEIFVVHRLDRDTSGVIVFAKTKQAHQELNAAFSSRVVVKKYKALVCGVVHEEDQTVELPIMIVPNQSKSKIDHKSGKASKTEVKVIERFSKYTLVECTLHTGRMHQIRVHMAAIGHPLMIDPLYGNSEAFYLSQIVSNYKVSKGKEERPIMDTLTLHSSFLSFDHPILDKKCSIDATLSKSFQVIIKRLRHV